MKKNFLVLLLSLFIFQTATLSAQERPLKKMIVKPERIQEQLIGTVKTVLIEFSKIKKVNSEWITEEKRTPWLSTTYNPEGYRIIEDQLYTDKSLDFQSIFTYASVGRLSKGVEYDYKGKLAFQWTYKHDPEKNEIEETRAFPNGLTFSTITYLYDHSGNMIEEKHKLEQTNNYFSWVYQYDPVGRKVEESYYLARPGKEEGRMKSLLNFKVVFSYDGQGNLLEETRYNAAGQSTSNKHFQYKYDETGNWISQIAKEPTGKSDSSVLEPTEVYYRTITYYRP